MGLIMILFNASNLRSAGGFTILDNFFKYSPRGSVFLVSSFYVKGLLERHHNCHITIVVPAWSTWFLGRLFYYLFWVERTRRYYNCATIISLGNIAARSKMPQKLYLHWPYFANVKEIFTGRINLSFFRRLFRYFYIILFIKYCDKIIVQSSLVCNRISEVHPSFAAKLYICAPGYDVIYDHLHSVSKPEFVFNRCLVLFYPAVMHSHKNFHFIKKLVRAIDNGELSINIKFVLTLSASEFQSLGFVQSSSIVNVGYLNRDDLFRQYNMSDALFMPTRHETFGLPYLEALSLGLPILSSNKDFARSICGDYAYYFNEDDVSSAIAAIGYFADDLRNGRNFWLDSRARLEGFSLWKDSVNEFIQI